MDFLNLRKALPRKPPGGANQRCPEAPVDVGDLALYQAAHHHVFGVSNRTGKREDLPAARMRPPATPDGSARDRRRQRRHRPRGGLKDHTMLPNESDRLLLCHPRVPLWGRRPSCGPAHFPAQ